MAKSEQTTYTVENTDGRRIYESIQTGRLYANTFPPTGCRLWKNTSLKKAEKICKKANEVWTGFEVKII